VQRQETGEFVLDLAGVVSKDAVSQTVGVNQAATRNSR